MKNTLPGLLMSAAVLGAALFAFSPRPLPAFPASTIAANHLQINGLAQAGSRTLAVTDALGFATGTYRLDVQEGRGRVTRTADDADVAGSDLQLDVADLGALLIGSVSPLTLAAAGLVRSADDRSPALLRAMLTPPRTPHGITYF